MSPGVPTAERGPPGPRPGRPGFRLPEAVAYLWAGPVTLLGLLAAALALVAGARARWVDGVLEVHGPRLGRWLAWCPGPPGGACAVTLGHVVLGRDAPTLERTRRHERVHVRQYARWGPLFIPAYLGASLWARVTGGDPYRDNRFEREAFGGEATGGEASGREEWT